MCESFTKLANKVGDGREEQTKLKMVKELMKNLKWSLNQALNASGIKGKELSIIAKQFQQQLSGLISVARKQWIIIMIRCFFCNSINSIDNCRIAIL